MDDTSQQAFEQAYRTYSDAVGSFIRTRVRGNGLAQDLTDKVFMIAHQEWEEYQALPNLPLEEWFLLIAEALCMPYRRRRPPRLGMN